MNYTVPGKGQSIAKMNPVKIQSYNIFDLHSLIIYVTLVAKIKAVK